MNTKTLVAKFLVLLVALLATSCATRGTERLSRIEKARRRFIVFERKRIAPGIPGRSSFRDTLARE